MPFNLERWNIGRKVEDELLPHLNKHFECDFQRSDDIFDILDFRNEEKKIIVEVKGRSNKSDQYPTTIITCGKLTEGLMEIERGYKVYYFFVFADKIGVLKLDPDDCDFNMKLTGTNHIPHYLIPIDRLEDFNVDE